MSFTESEALESPAVSAISLDQDVTRLTVTGIPNDPTSISALFAVVADHGVNVDIIVHNSHPDRDRFNVGFTAAGNDVANALKAIESLKSKANFSLIQVNTQSELAKVSAVGLGMKSHSGVAARVFDALAKNRIEVLMVSTSEIKISCVVSKADGIRAAKALHDVFFDEAVTL